MVLPIFLSFFFGHFWSKLNIWICLVICLVICDQIYIFFFNNALSAFLKFHKNFTFRNFGRMLGMDYCDCRWTYGWLRRRSYRNPFSPMNYWSIKNVLIYFSKTKSATNTGGTISTLGYGSSIFRSGGA